TAGAGSQNDAEHDRRAHGRAVGRFRQREAVRVVGEAYGAAEKARQIVRERAAVEPGGVRVLDHAGRGRNRARDADADRSALARVALDVGDESGDCREGLRVVAPRRRDAPSQPLAAVAIDREAFDLRPAEIDPDAHAPVLSWPNETRA